MTVEQERELETLAIDVNVGPQHPATHGVFRMVLAIDGEKVVDLIPHIGYLHRGAEKLLQFLSPLAHRRIARFSSAPVAAALTRTFTVTQPV